MKHILKQLIVGSAFLFFAGCAGEASVDEAKTDIPGNVPELADPESILMEPDAGFDSLISAFPKKWEQIEMADNEKIYRKSCTPEHPSVKLYTWDSLWILRTSYGTDAEEWQLLNMTGNLQSAEGQQFQDGIFVLSKLTYPDGQVHEVSYFWNLTAGFCSFGDLFAKGVQFADSTQFETFLVKEADCN